MKKKEKNSFYQRLSNLFDKLFWLIPASSLLASIWFPIIKEKWGKQFGIVDGEKAYTIFGIILSVIVMATPVFLAVLKVATEKHYDGRKVLSKELDDEKSLNALYSKLINGFDSLCEHKEQKIISSILNSMPDEIGYNPHEQLENIIREIDSEVSFMLSDNKSRIKSNDLYVGLYYSFENSDEWHCVNTQQRGMSTGDLLANKTTFNCLVNEKITNYIFYNSKEKAKKEQKYTPDELDRYESNEIKGSIAGYKFAITSNEKTYINIVLFITTYGKSFVEIGDDPSDLEYVENAKNNLEKLILEKFACRIRIEFATWYLSQHH